MTTDPSSTAWMEEGACRGYPNYDGLWFATDLVAIATAKSICGGCKVQGECLEYALVNHEDSGVWGGKSEEERRSDERRSTVRRHGSNIFFPGRRTLS